LRLQQRGKANMSLTGCTQGCERIVGSRVGGTTDAAAAAATAPFSLLEAKPRRHQVVFDIAEDAYIDVESHLPAALARD
jgi:hypothetical protein